MSHASVDPQLPVFAPEAAMSMIALGAAMERFEASPPLQALASLGVCVDHLRGVLRRWLCLGIGLGQVRALEGGAEFVPAMRQAAAELRVALGRINTGDNPHVQQLREKLEGLDEALTESLAVADAS